MKHLVALLALASAGAGAQIPVVGGPRNLAQDVAQAVSQVESAKKTLPASGSPDAARLAGIRFVNVMFGVPDEKIEAAVVESTATSALVRASYPSQQCNLTLVKNATANEFGWTVQLHKCQCKS